MTFVLRSDADILASYHVSLAQSYNKRHLVRHMAPNDPFFLLGDTAWELFHKCDEAEAVAYLRNRKAKGFNWVMAVILAESDGLVVPNRYGHLPLLGSDKPDPTRPNPEYFAFVDRVVSLASSMGITLALVPSWGRYITGGLAGGPIIFDEKNAYDYAKFLGERYPFHPFILGGDTNRFWTEMAWKELSDGTHPDKIELVDFKPVTDAFVKGLYEGDKAAKARYASVLPESSSSYVPFITYHSTQGWLGKVPSIASLQFPDAEWLTLDCVQSGHLDVHPMPDMQNHTWQGTSSYRPVRLMYEQNTMPVIDLEGHYEATHHAFNPAAPIWQAADIRNGAYQAVFAGSCGYVYGCNSIWQMHSSAETTKGLPIASAYTEWFYELDLPGAQQVSILRKLMLSLPNFFSRIPDQSLVLSDTHDTGDGLAGEQLISFMRGDGWSMVHLPYGGQVEVDMARACPLSRGWRGWWIDPKSGGKHIFARGDHGKENKKMFEAPSGGCKEEDWLLLLEQVWETGGDAVAC